MKKILIRIFIGLVAVITVLGLFSLGLINISNQVREEHFWHELLSAPMAELSRTELSYEASALDRIYLRV